MEMEMPFPGQKKKATPQTAEENMRLFKQAMSGA